MFAFFGFIFFRACNGCNSSYNNNDIDQAARYINPNIENSQAEKQSNATLILKDMQYQSGKYWHLYDIIGYYHSGNQKNKVFQRNTQWKQVNPSFFKKHIKHMGMEIMHYDNQEQKIKSITAPAGFSQFIGNDLFGKWEYPDYASTANNNNQNAVWIFKPEYQELKKWLEQYKMKSYNQKEINTYRRSYLPSGIFYYGGMYPPTYYSSRGVSAPKTYGTDYYPKQTQSSWHQKSSTFKRQVQEQLKRSSYNSNSSRNTHSGNRYYGSSTRSRSSGGYGK